MDFKNKDEHLGIDHDKDESNVLNNYPSKNNIENHEEQKQNIEAKIVENPPKTSNWPCTIEYYQPYFNIDERDIKMRLRCAFLPRKPEFLQIIGKNPDLWVPVWVSTSIIFLLFAAGNLSNFLSSSNKDTYKYEFNFIPIALATVYGLFFVVPFLITLLFRLLGATTQFFDSICMYGYAQASFVPILVLCIIPYNVAIVQIQKIAQWIFLSYGVLNSSVFLIMNYWDDLQKIGPKKPIVILVLVAIQVGLLLMFKLYFFHLVYNDL